MKKEISKKLEVWTKKDVAKVVAVYIINVFVLAFLFVFLELINGDFDFNHLSVYFSNPQYFLNLMVLTTVVAFFMAICFLVTDRDFLHNPVNSEMMFLIMEVSLVLCFFCSKYVHPYFSPFAFAGLLALYLTNSRISLFANTIYSFMFIVFFTFLGLDENFVGNFQQSVLFFVINLASGILATFVMDGVYSRFRLIARSFIISVPQVIGIILSLIAYGENDLLTAIVASVCSGPVAVSAFILFLPVFEFLFTKVSCFKYAELTDHKSKFIKKMIEEAPGTFNHSIIVSNIAEACATAIGEDALLARTCAYYHDVGKLRRPEYFKENQSDVNPHDDLTPELSANIIKSHTQDGHDLLIKSRLPKEIADVCLQHHGTSPMLFFYDKAKKFTDGEVDLAQFCYPGPKPKTKVAAILMVADSAEAATRTLPDRSREKVTEVVRKLVSDRMKLGQFDDCEITLKELNIIINTVINSLTGVYHNRVEYPKVSLDGLENDTQKD